MTPKRKSPEDSVLRKLAALIAKEKSLRGSAQPHSLHEAEATARAIQRLLLRHHLSLSDVEAMQANDEQEVDALLFSPEEVGVRGSQRRVYWQEELAAIVAHAHLCSLLSIPGSNLFFFVGRRQDREVCAYAYGMLLKFASERSLSEARSRTSKEPSQAGGYRNSWLRGYNLRIAQRYRELESQMVEQAIEQNLALTRTIPSGTGITTLSLATRLNEVRDLSKEWVESNVAQPPVEILGGEVNDLDGLGDGFRAGGEPTLGNRAELGAQEVSTGN